MLDASGNYLYSGLEAGNYFVKTVDTGFFDELWDDIPCAQENCIVTNGSLIAITNNIVVANFILEDGGEIQGTVYSSDVPSQPITDGYVIIYSSTGSYLGLDLLDISGSYSYSGLDVGNYYVKTVDTGFNDELWDDIPCIQENCIITTGGTISVNNNSRHANFELDTGGMIVGLVTSTDTGQPVSDGYVVIYDSTGSYLGLDLLDNSGNYSYSGLDVGNYYVKTVDTGFNDELWNDIPCIQENCIVTSGNQVNVSGNIVAVDFQLSSGGVISGVVTSSVTSNPITDGYVVIYDSSGSYLGLDLLDSFGKYSYSGLDDGNYYIKTVATGFFDELWDNIPCAQEDCLVTSGTSIAITGVEVIANFSLTNGGAILGSVTSSSNGLPISDGYVVVYDSSGSYLGLDLINNSGNFKYSGLDAGNYFVKTVDTGYFDELWNNLPCAQENCIVTSGNSININGNTATANFALGDQIDEIFANSFE